MTRSLPKQDKTLWQQSAADGQAERQRRQDETERLVRCAMRGDRQSLSQLCRVVAKGVLFSVRRLLPGYDDADDVAQEVLIRLCAGIHSLKTPQAFGGWLNGIEVNEARRHMAKETKRSGRVVYFDEYPDGLAVEEENEELLPQEYTLKEEECRIMVEAIDALPARQREAVILHYYKDMNITETAQIMETTQQVASRQLKQARENVKKELLKRAGHTGDARLGSFALLPIGPLLADALKRQEEQVDLDDMDEAWAQRAAENAVKNARLPKAAPGGTTSGMAKGIIASVAVTCIAVPALVIGLAMGGAFRGNTAQPYAMSAAAEIGVVFSGGDSRHAHLNPQSAAIQAEGEECAARGWVITPQDGGEELYSGEGDEAIEPFALLPEGSYVITFTLEGKTGSVYTVYSNFQKRP